jgi:hypothetical protein
MLTLAAYGLRHVAIDNNQLDLERLRARLREKPRTKIGQVRQAWPYIKELFDAGHSLKDVWAWLNEIGIDIGYARLSHYVGQLRRSDRQRATDPVPSIRSAPPITSLEAMHDPALVAPVPQESADRPLTKLFDRERNRPGFHFNSDPDPKKLI